MSRSSGRTFGPKLALQVLEHIRAALAEVSGRQSDQLPGCPWCFDGDHVRLTRNARKPGVVPEIAVFTCSCCRRHFTDLRDTPINRTTMSMLLWAGVALADSKSKRRALCQATGKSMQDVRHYRVRLERDPEWFSAWHDHLVVRAVTLDKITEAFVATYTEEG